MNVITSVDWSNWRQITSGSGSVGVSGSKVTCNSPVGSTARIAKYLKVFPGDLVKVSFFAKRNSGVDATSGGVAIDFPTEATLVNRVRIVSSEWTEHSLVYSVPLTAAATSYVTISVGVFTADAGEIEALLPKIEIESSVLGVPRIFAQGLITMAAGVASINQSFSHGGIKSLAYNAGTSTLTLTLNPGIAIAGNIQAINPIFLATMTPDAGSGALSLAPRVGNFTPSTGTLVVQFVDTTSGSVVDVSTYGTFYFSLLCIL